ncbi:MAG: hypothetical protein VB065_14080 [Eubacteriales bacterium]|nr:hypothetical protein [Christensenellaceae bacterium]MEA5067164.1 hypothetical protein [Eubacteriales bacterium]
MKRLPALVLVLTFLFGGAGLAEEYPYNNERCPWENNPDIVEFAQRYYARLQEMGGTPSKGRPLDLKKSGDQFEVYLDDGMEFVLNANDLTIIRAEWCRDANDTASLAAFVYALTLDVSADEYRDKKTHGYMRTFDEVVYGVIRAEMLTPYTFHGYKFFSFPGNDGRRFVEAHEIEDEKFA